MPIWRAIQVLYFLTSLSALSCTWLGIEGTRWKREGPKFSPIWSFQSHWGKCSILHISFFVFPKMASECMRWPDTFSRESGL